MHDLDALRRQCDELRHPRGALIALDDAGSGYSGLQQLAALRPQVVKLDRALVSDADTDPVRVALAEMLGEFAGRDRRLAAGGGHRDPGRARGVREARRPPGPGLAAPAARRLSSPRSRRRPWRWCGPRWPGRRRPSTVTSLLRPIRQHGPDEEMPAVPPVVLLGAHGEPDRAAAARRADRRDLRGTGVACA